MLLWWAAKLGQSERDIRVGGVDSVPSALFTQVPGLAYAALGHLHRPQEIALGDLDSARPPVRLVYSGSPVPLSFGEAEFESLLLSLSLTAPD